MNHNLIPEGITHFTTTSVSMADCHGLTICFYRYDVDKGHPIADLPAMLSRADVCQQIADKPLADRMEPRNKYDREITPGLWVDVYDVLDAFKVTRSAVAHAVKKLLAPGQRGVKSEIADLKEARDSIDRAIQKLDEWV
jgi:hypothetical protein